MIPTEEQHQFEEQDEDDGEFEELAARDGDLLDGETIDVIQRFQLVVDAGPPARDGEASAYQRQQPGAEISPTIFSAFSVRSVISLMSMNSEWS